SADQGTLERRIRRLLDWLYHRQRGRGVWTSGGGCRCVRRIPPGHRRRVEIDLARPRTWANRMGSADPNTIYTEPYSRQFGTVKRRANQDSFNTCSIAMRGPLSGSRSTRLLLLNSIVSRDLTE